MTETLDRSASLFDQEELLVAPKPARNGTNGDDSITIASNGTKLESCRGGTATTSKVKSTKKLPAVKPVMSPYEVCYCAEDEEPLFQELQTTLMDDPYCVCRKLYRCICQSKLTYSDVWLSEGLVHETKVGIPTPSTLVLCLNHTTFGKADLAVLKQMAQALGLEGMVKKFAEALRLANASPAGGGQLYHYPKIENPASTLRVPKKEVIKSLLFLSRVYCAKNYFKKSFEDAGGNLEQKVRRCLDICEENASFAPVAKKKRHCVEKLEGGGGSKEGEFEPAPAKRRRVAEAMNELVAIKQSMAVTKETKEEPDVMTTSAILAKFDELEDYFRSGLQAVQELREEVCRKDAIYKKALNDKIWGSAPPISTPSSRHGCKQVKHQSPLKDDGGDDDDDDNFSVEDTEFSRSRSGTRKWDKVIDEEEEEHDELETPAPIKPDLAQPMSIKVKTSKMKTTQIVCLENHIESKPVEFSAKKYGEGGIASKANKFSEENPSENKTVSQNDDDVFKVDKAVEKRIRELVRESVWRKIKIIKSDDHLQKVARFIANLLTGGLDSLGMPLETWTQIYGPVIKAAFGTHRCKVRDAMKKAAEEYMDKNGGSLFSVGDLLKLRKSETDTELEAFQWLWESFLECVSRKSYWATHKHKTIISEKTIIGDTQDALVLKSDEAYCLLMFENCRDKWMAGWHNSKHGTTIVCHTLYTPPGRKPDSYSLLNSAGKERWGELLKHVKEDRASDQGNEAEKRMLQRIQRQHGLL